MDTRSNVTPASQPVKASHKASITGFILALLSLASSGIAHLLIFAQYTPNGPTNGSIDKQVGNAIATGTTTLLGAIFGMGFIVASFVFAFVAVLFILLRLRKVRVAGLLFSIVAILIIVWSISISLGALDVIKAHPAS
jgi:hypothetical protein